MDRIRIYIIYLLLFIAVPLALAQNKQVGKLLPQGRAFAVDDVEMAPDTIYEYPFEVFLEQVISKKIFYSSKEQEGKKLVPSSGNSLMKIVYKCYKEHRPLVLSPDIIWLTIAQGASKHIRLNMDSLDNLLFKSDVPKELNIRNDSIEFGAKYWQQFVDDISKDTRKYTKSDAYAFFVPNFSTTDNITTTAYQINLLEAYQDKFDYVVTTGCGIPYITLRGEKQDWEKIDSQLDYLQTIGMSDWSDELKPVIREFINTYDGQTNTPFWQDIYKNRQMYLVDNISGWILKLFPYIEGFEKTELNDFYTELFSESGMQNKHFKGVKKEYTPNPYIKGYDYLLSDIQDKSIPSSINEVKIVWDNINTGTKQDMWLYSGMLGAYQYKDKSLEPAMFWAVCSNEDAIIDYKMYDLANYTKEFDSQEDKLWMPNVVDDVKKAAKYKSSDKDLLVAIEGSIKAKYPTEITKLANTKISFVVLANGYLSRIEVECESDKIKEIVKGKLSQTSGHWTPAKGMYEYDEMMTPAIDDKQAPAIMDVNSIVSIILFETKNK